MTLDAAHREHQAAVRAFRATVTAEQASWRDAKYRRIAERQLEPLLREVDRFDGELLEASRAARAAGRRLRESEVR